MAKFPSFKVPAIKQSNHNRSSYYRTTMAPGILYPIRIRRCIPGDIIDLDMESLVNTQALLTPKLGSFQLKVETFFAGTSLYCPTLWRNNVLYGSQPYSGVVDVKFPYWTPSQVVTSETTSLKSFPKAAGNSFASLFGLGPGFQQLWNCSESLGFANDYPGTKFNAIPYMMYMDIVRNYYANQQTGDVPFVNINPLPGSDKYVWSVNYIDRSRLDRVFLENLEGKDFLLALADIIDPDGDKPTTEMVDAMRVGYVHAGLALRQYSPDRMNVFLNQQFLEANSQKTAINVQGNSITYEQIIMAKKLRSIGLKDALAGGRFSDWVRSQFGVTPKIMDDMPTYLGGWSTDILFDDIRASATTNVTTEAGEEIQYLGDKASSARAYARAGRKTIVCDRPGYYMVIASIVPRVDYASFVDRWATELQLDDLFKNELNGVGLQDLLMTDLVNHSAQNVPHIDGDLPGQPSVYALGVAKQPAFIDYMTDVNRVNGRLYDDTLMRSWVNLREFQLNCPTMTSTPTDSWVDGFGDPIIPQRWNGGFTNNAPNAENFIVQFYFSEFVRSNVSKRLMPHL